MPGDGNCLWHSLAVQANLKGPEHLPEGGLQLKEQYLQWMHDHADEAAALWGCEEAAILPLIQHWREDWADGRALLLASFLANVSILLFNRHDNRIEVFHAGRGGPLSGGVWTVLYDGQHYDSLRNPGADEIMKVRNMMPMVPWKHSQKNPLRGGYVGRIIHAPPSVRNRRLLQRHPKPQTKSRIAGAAVLGGS